MHEYTMMKLGRIHHLSIRCMGEWLDQIGLSRGQPPILDYLASHEGCIQRELAERFTFNPASITSLLGTMESSGLIRRESLEGDRRAQRVFLTDLGRQKQKLLRRAHEQLEQIAFSDFSPEEHARFEEALVRIAANLHSHRSNQEGQ